MTGLHDLALFSLTVLILNLTPGVDMLFVITRTLQQGVKAGLAGSIGICAGCVVHALAAAFGLAALMAASAGAFELIRWAGAAYLGWLAVGMLRQAVRPAAATPATPAAAQDNAPASPDAARLFRQGLLTNVLNPKVALFFLALLPQFIDAGAEHKTLAFLALGGWFVLQSALYLAVLVLLVAPLRRWQAPRALLRALDAAAGGLFALLALRLALTPRP